MKTKTNLRTWIRLTAATFSLAATLAQANEAKLLWEIGKADRNNAEFALAPGDFSGYRDDARFVVGRSEAKKDWPYVQPGPLDSWAGTRPHTFTVVFGVKQKPDAGACRLLVDLLDTHSVSPPKLKVVVNGRPFELPLPKGASDASIRGEPAKGRPHVARVEFPATLLRAGRNEITLTTLSGSWLLYDRVALETPAGVETELVEAQGTAIVAAEVSPAPVERDGKRCHRITVTLVHSGDIVNAVIRLDDATEQLARRMLTLASGRHTLELFVPAVSKARYATLAVTVAGETLDSRPVTLVPGVEQVVLVFKTHFDIGYTDMASNVVQRYRTTMIDQALAVVDQNRDLPTAQQFAWTITGWPMHQILDWPQQTPERKARVERA
ncbi:MAG: polysaccharide lyase family protein, partial [Verrucomicrobiae bacterium]|nr:polysaccharide lyase family protein [Verrucomicrobiae bacterium]